MHTVWECRAVCVDAISDTEAVLGKTIKLTCISCMKREEITAQTKVSWYYKPDRDAVRQEVRSSFIVWGNHTHATYLQYYLH